MSQYSRRKRQRRGGPATALLIIFSIFSIIFVMGFAAVVWVAQTANGAPKIAGLHPKKQGVPSEVFSSDGTRIGFIQGDTISEPVSNIPSLMLSATVAVEDRRFYKHGGVDLTGVARATARNLSSGQSKEGASTLTMQLVRNIYYKDKSKTIERKIREAKMAIDLENEHPGTAGKQWILNQYINNVPYGTVNGQTAIGAGAAARIFFNKTLSDLRLDQFALLAGLPQAPSAYNPFTEKAAAKARRNEVLAKMKDEGYISLEDFRLAIKRPLGTHHSKYYNQRREGYIFDYVKRSMIEKYGSFVLNGGMKIYTTIDLKLQRDARRAMANNLTEGGPAAALVSIDPKNGFIKAMASSQSYSQSKFNLAADGQRQPGSTFKVMVLMAALRQGIDINQTTYESRPLDFWDNKTRSKIDVRTFGDSYNGTTTIFEGLVSSDNTVFQQLALDVGPDKVRAAAYDLGIKSRLDAYPAEALGGLTNGVSPLEMTSAYATINNRGYRVNPTIISKVVFADGQVKKSVPRPVKVFTSGETREAVLAMQANAERGTGTAASLDCPTAGKTGTTNDSTDAWFDGFTSSLNTTVWVGYPKRAIPMNGMTGGAEPSFIWHDYMTAAMEGRPCDDFPEPKHPFRQKPFESRFSGGFSQNSSRYP